MEVMYHQLTGNAGIAVQNLYVLCTPTDSTENAHSSGAGHLE